MSIFKQSNYNIRTIKAWCVITLPPRKVIQMMSGTTSYIIILIKKL